MVAGAPFPDLLEWTWGEVVEFISCRNEARRDALRDWATMLFRTSFLTGKVFSAKRGEKFSVMDEYGFLWSDEERKEHQTEQNEAAAMNAFMQMNAAIRNKNEEEGEDTWEKKLGRC